MGPEVTLPFRGRGDPGKSSYGRHLGWGRKEGAPLLTLLLDLLGLEWEMSNIRSTSHFPLPTSRHVASKRRARRRDHRKQDPGLCSPGPTSLVESSDKASSPQSLHVSANLNRVDPGLGLLGGRTG